MLFTIFTKPDCPYCVRAKQLLDDKGFKYEEFEVLDTLDLKDKAKLFIDHLEEGPINDLRTVPQIFATDFYTEVATVEHIGGYTELVAYFKDMEATVELRNRPTVFNTDNKGYESGSYPLFLGEALGMTDTINTPYPILDRLFQAQSAQIWNEFEVDLTQDRIDMVNAPASVTGLMVKTLLYQWIADTVASRSISGILLENVSNSDLESWYNVVAFFESIHARTYSHIVKQTFVDPNEAIKEGYEDAEILKRGEKLIQCFNDLANAPFNLPVEERRPLLYKALVALYLLEGLNFMASFAITFGIAETGIFQGISQLVTLICRDEMLHAQGGKEVLTIEQQQHPKVFRELNEDLQALFDEVIDAEEAFADYLFSESRQCIGITKDTVKDYVHYMSGPIAKTLDLKVRKEVKENPLPYMDNYIDTSKVQVAAQELQLTNYLLNAVAAPNEKEVENLLSELKKEYL